MKQALEIAIDYMNERLEDHDCKYQRHPATEAERINILADIETVKEALAKQEHDCTRSHPHEHMSKECELRTEVARLKNQQAHKSQAQLQLKMTALEKAWFDGYEDDINNALQDLRQEIVSLATAKQEQGEPVAYVHADELEELSHCNGMSVWAENALAHTDDSLSKQLLPSGYVALYPAPQQRKPLTDDEKLGLATSWFAEDWAIKNAIGLLNDHETFQGIKEQP